MKIDQFRDKTIFGFWVYLMTDLVLFATLFATFAVLRGGTAGGPDGAELFSLPFVLVETLLLLTSSFTCGLALLAINRASKKEGATKGPSKAQALLWFGITFALGAAFLAMELTEFAGLVHEGAGWQRSAFLSAFFTLVGTHGLHIASGLIWMLVLLAQLVHSGFTTSLVRRFVMLSLFWHMLDIVWIFIFTIVYLMGAV